MRIVIAVSSIAALLFFLTVTVKAESSQEASGAPEPALLSPAEQAAGFVRLWSETKYNFAFFDKVPDVDWDKVLEEYLPRFDTPRDKYAYYKILEECLARLHDTHTRVNVYLTPEDDRPSLLVRPIEGKAIVVDLTENAEFSEQGIKAGSEILTVDGRDVKDILEKDIYPWFSASTPQMRDRFAYQHILDGPRDSEASVVIRDPQGTERCVTLTRNGRNSPKTPRRPSDIFEYRELEGGLAYVAFKSFMNDKGAREFYSLLGKVRGSKGLIIDVRNNAGGNTGNGYDIISHLTDKPLQGSKWKSPQYVPVHKAWGEQQKWYEADASVIEPDTSTPPFLGPVVVLANGGTGSAAEDFLIPLHYAHRATLVGERTSGSTGQSITVELPGGSKALVCAKRDTYPDGREFVGIGVVPDVEVQATVEDAISGQDTVLEKGIEVLKGLAVAVESTQ